ncbi:MAG: hypothetical protein HY721_19610 [Planctomycetes bacterium]|nr:hypothetical protein [Planctomycetota bacterium]
MRRRWVATALLALGSAIPLGAADFVRGDANSDGVVSLADAEAVFAFLFRTGAMPCMDAADANDSGGVDIPDGDAILEHVLGAGFTPPAPFPDPGPDPTADETDFARLIPMDCQSYGGGSALEDPAARLEVASGIAEGGADGSAHLLIALGSGVTVTTYGGTLRFPPGLVTGVREQATELVSGMYFQGRLDGDRLRFAVSSGLVMRPTSIPPGPLEPVVEIELCLAKGTRAGDYEAVLESGELVEVDTGRSVRPALGSGVLSVLSDVAASERCDEPDEPPPPPINAEYELVGGTAPPGGVADVVFQIRADQEVQGYSYSFDYDEGVLEGLDAEPIWRKPDGSEFSFATFEFNNADATLGNAGVDDGFAIGAVVIDFNRPIGLPAGRDNEVLRFRFRVRPETAARSTELRFMDGGKGKGAPVPNRVSANGDIDYTQDSAASFVFVTGLLGIAPDIITFLRADSNGDGKVDISDPLATLADLFFGLGVRRIACYDAADADDSGAIDLSDAVFTLQHLFLGAPEALPCVASADVGADGAVDVSDPVALLAYLYLGGPAPPEPFRTCGFAGTKGGLACEEFPGCE